MKEKIHDLKTALEVLRIEQTVSFDNCQKLMTDMHEKTGFEPPNFEISGNQWCALVNLAVARFGNTTSPQPKEQAPVAFWLYGTSHIEFEKQEYHDEFEWVHLYTSPPPQRPWVGLTNAELAEFSDARLGSYDLCLEVEAKLKEKNT